MKYFKYVLVPRGKGSASPENLRLICLELQASLKTVAKEYKIETDEDLVIGRSFVRSRSVVLLLGFGTSLNVVSESLSVWFHNHNVNGVGIPWYG